MQFCVCYVTIFAMFFLCMCVCIAQRHGRVQETQLKCTKARNDYLLNLAAANAAMNKYYLQDVSTLIDVRIVNIMCVCICDPCYAGTDTIVKLNNFLSRHKKNTPTIPNTQLVFSSFASSPSFSPSFPSLLSLGSAVTLVSICPWRG